MKKIIGLVLCLLTAAALIVSCSGGGDEEDKGVTIPVYLGTEIANFDPAFGNLDDASAKVLSLIYEGLFKYDSNGKVVKAQAKSVKVLDDPDDDYYAIEIKLKDTSWSNGTLVQASDYIYAWKRILDPNFRGEAACLLYQIKNARECAKGDRSIDDLGVTDEGIQVLRIEFEGPTDYDKFYENLASPMLVPLQEIAVNKVAKDWSSSQSIVVCNGPFCVRTYSPGNTLVLERNIYYRRNAEKEKDKKVSVTKYVTPYRLSCDLSAGAEGNEKLFKEGSLAYISELPLSMRNDYKASATVSDTMSVLSYVFNTRVAPFDNADVRTALSEALDRQKIAETVVFAKPATGLIADGVFNTEYSKNGKSFREACGDILSTSANLESAKSKLKSAGVSGGDIVISVRNNEVDVAVAEYVKSVWSQLGFSVTLKKYSYEQYTDEKEYDLVKDAYLEDYDKGNFQVISVDYMMLSTDAFANLAHFTTEFAGGFIDMTVAQNEYLPTPHVCGYESEAYAAKIEEAFGETNLSKRAELLHEAEKILLGDMPIMPLVQLQNAYVSDNVKNVDTSYYGYGFFIDADLKNDEKYISETEAAK